MLFGNCSSLLIRHLEGVRHADVADIAKCDESTVSRLVSGERPLSTDLGLTLIDAMPNTPLAEALIARANATLKHLRLAWADDAAGGDGRPGVEPGIVAMVAAAGRVAEEIQTGLEHDGTLEPEEEDKALAAIGRLEQTAADLRRRVQEKARQDRERAERQQRRGPKLAG